MEEIGESGLPKEFEKLFTKEGLEMVKNDTSFTYDENTVEEEFEKDFTDDDEFKHLTGAKSDMDNMETDGAGEPNQAVLISSKKTDTDAEKTYEIDGKQYTFYYREGVEQIQSNSVWDENEQNILHSEFNEPVLSIEKAFEKDEKCEPRWTISRNLRKCIVQAPPRGLGKKYWNLEMWNYWAEDWMRMWENY